MQYGSHSLERCLHGLLFYLRSTSIDEKSGVDLESTLYSNIMFLAFRRF
jgi:hypothetical protein